MMTAAAAAAGSGAEADGERRMRRDFRPCYGGPRGAEPQEDAPRCRGNGRAGQDGGEGGVAVVTTRGGGAGG